MGKTDGSSRRAYEAVMRPENRNRTQQELADELHVAPSLVGAARTVFQLRPDLGEKILAGELGAQKALLIAKGDPDRYSEANRRAPKKSVEKERAVDGTPDQVVITKMARAIVRDVEAVYPRMRTVEGFLERGTAIPGGDGRSFTAALEKYVTIMQSMLALSKKG